MFEHRLGSLLGRDIAEIRAMPYPEFYRWQLFYQLEPWGWALADMLKAEILTMLYNMNRSKGKAKDVKDFMQARLPGILKELAEPELPAEISREDLIKQIKRDFGVR